MVTNVPTPTVSSVFSDVRVRLSRSQASPKFPRLRLFGGAKSSWNTVSLRLKAATTIHARTAKLNSTHHHTKTFPAPRTSPRRTLTSGVTANRSVAEAMVRTPRPLAA